MRRGSAAVKSTTSLGRSDLLMGTDEYAIAQKTDSKRGDELSIG